MSDDDQDIDIESDEEDEDSDFQQLPECPQSYTQAEKRAHHNALERKRRDHIKDSFSNLRDTVIALKGEKVASRVQILKRAAEYIDEARDKAIKQQENIDSLRRQNFILESELKILENAVMNNIAAGSCGVPIPELDDDSNYESETETSDSESEDVVEPVKKIKTEPVEWVQS
ncbi:hypothetical protein PV327_007553 [Microctonus hyperodae]|uniref:BHLH domain-containing protein n=1 Tax=Microctonus hyperodae TaxID=165561 RepID=A0AA39G0Q2_MICHY|nr:hypothetical protein PV327_007553 [Microctonus hyperodae]